MAVDYELLGRAMAASSIERGLLLAGPYDDPAPPCPEPLVSVAHIVLPGGVADSVLNDPSCAICNYVEPGGCSYRAASSHLLPSAFPFAFPPPRLGSGRILHCPPPSPSSASVVHMAVGHLSTSFHSRLGRFSKCLSALDKVLGTGSLQGVSHVVFPHGITPPADSDDWFEYRQLIEAFAARAPPVRVSVVRSTGDHIAQLRRIAQPQMDQLDAAHAAALQYAGETEDLETRSLLEHAADDIQRCLLDGAGAAPDVLPSPS